MIVLFTDDADSYQKHMSVNKFQKWWKHEYTLFESFELMKHLILANTQQLQL